MPRIRFVGAGPGASDLLTLRAIRILRRANVILYDALVSADVLEMLPHKTTKINVGKRAGNHCMKQIDINRLMVRMARHHDEVIRQKGGDPMVFARLTEEVDFVKSFGVEVDIVPGISSALGVPGSRGIPLTERGVSSSFWVTTGTNRQGEISSDLKWAARSSCTIIVLMGKGKMREICSYVGQYRNKHTPVAYINDGTLPHEQCITGTIGGIPVPSPSSKGPGIIVIGEVVDRDSHFFHGRLMSTFNADTICEDIP